jgi:predicted nucleotidyltransferase
MNQSQIEQFQRILTATTTWAEQRCDIHALALVGSWARNAAIPDSDIDLIALADDPQVFRTATAWLDELDWQTVGAAPESWRDQDYGMVWSRHLHLADGTEIEFGFGPPAWAATNPADQATAQVIRDGCRILYDPHGHVAQLKRYVSSTLGTETE